MSMWMTSSPPRKLYSMCPLTLPSGFWTALSVKVDFWPNSTVVPPPVAFGFLRLRSHWRDTATAANAASIDADSTLRLVGSMSSPFSRTTPHGPNRL